MIQKQPESMVVLVMFQLKPEAAICARVGARLVKIDEDFGVTEWPAASVTSCDSGLGQTNWLLSNQVYCAEGLGLKLHGRLFEARASRGGRPRPLVL